MVGSALTREVHMKIRAVVFVSILALCLTAPTTAKPGQQKALSLQEMIDLQMKYAVPVAEHDYLKKYVGTWDVDGKSWMQPGAEPEAGKGTMKSALIFGGRYVKCDYQGTMTDQPLMGLQIIGFDIFEKKYTSFWIDSMSTHFYQTSGTLDPTGKVLTEGGLWPDPVTGGTREVKVVTTWIREGQYRYEMFMAGPDGKPFKSVELTFTKKM
jgi:hypothetical protein